jgi:hypothetical protein
LFTLLPSSGMVWLAFVARNDWSVFPVILGLITVGHGQGALVTLLTESRLRALKIGFLVLSGMALLALIPCGWLPDYRPGEIPSGPPSGKEDRS